MKAAAVKASAIAAALGKELIGDNVELEKTSTIARDVRHALMFARSFSDDLCDLLNSATCSLVIADTAYAGRLTIPHILSDNPRLDYGLSAEKFFAPSRPQGIAATAKIAPAARIGKGVFIGEYCVIEDDVEIGDHTYLAHHVVVSRGVKIGRNCIIQSGTVIGQRALAFEYNEEELPVAIPHLGGTVIGDYVEIGSLCTVCAGTMAPTIVGDYAKIDDHVHIAHNCQIGRAVMITAGTTLAGSVRLSDYAWIGANSSIKNGIKIGLRALVGIGSVVVKNVEGGKIVIGNPARVLRDRKGLTES